MIPYKIIKDDITVGRQVPQLEWRNHEGYRNLPLVYRKAGLVHEATCSCGKIILVNIRRIPIHCGDTYFHKTDKQKALITRAKVEQYKERIKQLQRNAIHNTDTNKAKIKIRIQELEKELQLLKEAPIP